MSNPILLLIIKPCIYLYLFFRVLELAIGKELECADIEATGLILRRRWRRIKDHGLLVCWVQWVGTSVG